MPNHENGERKTNGGSVTWKWVAGSLAGAVLFLCGAWMTSNSTEIAALKLAQRDSDKEQSQIKEKAGRIEENVKTLQKDVQDVKEQQKDTNKKLDENNKKLDELLRRTR